MIPTPKQHRKLALIFSVSPAAIRETQRTWALENA